MAETGHIADRLAAWMAGDLPDPEAAAVREHLASCRACSEERDLLRQALAVVAPLHVEARPGFAVRVAALAGERRPHPIGAPWWRWAFGGGVAAAAAAAVVLAIVPGTRKNAGDDVVLAQRLELFEDLSVVQNQDALKDLDVVAVLHTLEPEGKP